MKFVIKWRLLIVTFVANDRTIVFSEPLQFCNRFVVISLKNVKWLLEIVSRCLLITICFNFKQKKLPQNMRNNRACTIFKMLLNWRVIVKYLLENTFCLCLELMISVAKLLFPVGFNYSDIRKLFELLSYVT